MLKKSVGIVFPGQGSQSVGMLKDIADQFSEVAATYGQASEVLGYDLWKLVLEGPATELDKTTHTQPALLAGSYAIWRILRARTAMQPSLLAGHSLGEYTALACAEAMTFQDAIQLVAARGQYMQEAVPGEEGALAAIVGLEEAEVQSICEKARVKNEVLSPANYNSPGQVVIAGHRKAVERACLLAKEAGAKLTKLLPVSAPSHCILMQPAAERLAILLNKIAIKKPCFPLLNNVDVGEYNTPDAIRDGLVRQLTMPVRWVEVIQAFAKAGVETIIECGPGKVLSGLNKRIHADFQLMNTNDFTQLQQIFKEFDHVTDR